MLLYSLGVEGNPYTMNNSKRPDTFLRRCVSVRGSGVFKSQENTQIKRVSGMIGSVYYGRVIQLVVVITGNLAGVRMYQMLCPLSVQEVSHIREGKQ